MSTAAKATRINLFDFKSPQMRAFHLSWFAFLLCFFAWFGMAPFMPLVRQELHLSPDQVKYTVIASVAVTFFARLLFGWLCDWIGPRLSYALLLIVGSIPVMCIGLAHTFAVFLIFRLAIGIIGASFVITQYHTSMMFAPNVVGTANAMTGGWGNMGGGITQKLMPLLLGAFIALGFTSAISWRLSMVAAGVVCLLTGIAYYLLTQDTPQGNYLQLRGEGKLPPAKKQGLLVAARDSRVWCLFVLYGACFGVELTIDNIAHLYFHDYFHMGIAAAGWAAFSFGGLNLFARALGGYFSDRINRAGGLNGRVWWLFAIIFAEGLAMMLFSEMTSVFPMLVAFLLFGLLVCMGCGATYAVVPFINEDAVGSVSGIVGAGGNAAAVAAGFLFGKTDWHHSILLLGALVSVSAFLSLGVKAPSAKPMAEEEIAFSPAV